MCPEALREKKCVHGDFSWVFGREVVEDEVLMMVMGLRSVEPRIRRRGLYA